MTELHVLPATAERWPDIEVLIGGDGYRGRWCQEWHGPVTAYGIPKAEPRREALRLKFAFDDPAPTPG